MVDVNRDDLLDDQTDLLRRFGDGLQGDIWTALPGFIVEWNPTKMTCQVQPTLMTRVSKPDGTAEWIKMPVLLDCPVIFPNGGGFSLTFPIAVNDECLVIFGSRCIDSWWQSGGLQRQAEFRMHDLSDGFVLPGPRSLKRMVPNLSSDSVQLRSDDGSAYIGIAPDHTITLSTLADAKVAADNVLAIAQTRAIVEAPAIQLTGNVSINGTLNVSGDVTTDAALKVAGVVTAPNFKSPTIELNAHTHTGVKGGGDTSGPPKAGT